MGYSLCTNFVLETTMDMNEIRGLKAIYCSLDIAIGWLCNSKIILLPQREPRNRSLYLSRSSRIEQLYVYAE